MKYLTPQQVLAIHDQAIKRFGGSPGIRDVGLLESAVGRARASFGGQDLYPTIFLKVAALMHSLLRNHPFLDGNKRTSYASAGIFLKMNGYELIPLGKKSADFILRAENKKLEIEELAAWLQKNSKKI